MLLYEGGVQLRADKAGVPCNTPQEVSVGGQPIYLQHVALMNSSKGAAHAAQRSVVWAALSPARHW